MDSDQQFLKNFILMLIGQCLPLWTAMSDITITDDKQSIFCMFGWRLLKVSQPLTANVAAFTTANGFVVEVADTQLLELLWHLPK